MEKPDERADTGAELGEGREDLYAQDRQELRVAVVMIGGVSLAIWIGGVTLELQHLDLAGRHLDRSAVPLRVYQELLEFLHARARVDVIAGTSAGGVNGGFLALGVVHELDLSVLGDVWENEGALSDLLRSPLQKNPPSLLRGDDYYLERLKEAYQRFRPDSGRFPDLPGRDHPVELFLTTTLFAGKESTFTDDLGRPIEDTEYTGTFAFGTTESFSRDCGHLGEVAVLDQLATASRCTSSFPAAFEPHWVTVRSDRPGSDGRWESDAGRASFGQSQYVVDGGVLLNKPIRPALEAIYRQSATDEVRRVLAYVVPDPGKMAKGSSGANQDSRPPVPVAGDVLLSMVTRLRTADSVSHELEEIRTRNQRARDRREGRTRIVAALLDGGPSGAAPGSDDESLSPVAVEAWPGYRRVRARLAGLTIGRIIGEAQSAWSAAEIADAVVRVPRLPFIPSDSDLPPNEGLRQALGKGPADWDWGFTTVERLGALAIDLLKRALWLAPIDAQALRARIRRSRGAVHDVLGELRVQVRKAEEFWRKRVPEGDGPRGAGAPLERRQQLDDWLRTALEEWRREPPVPNGTLYEIALRLAEKLKESGSDLRELCEAQEERTEGGAIKYLNPLDPDGSELRRLKRPVEYLHLNGDTSREVTPAHVLRRMLQLDVVQLAFTGVTDDVEQEVELVEITAAAPEPDGNSPPVEDKLTGVQLGHFGAFYRRSWRVNDWIWGRVDGAARLVETLLSPERLRQLHCTPDAALAAIEYLAIGPEGEDRAYLQRRWQKASEACRAELACISPGRPAPRTLPLCARAVAYRLQTEILRAELPRLAVAIETEEIAETPVPTKSLVWLRDFRRDVPPGTSPEKISAEVLWCHFNRIHEIGKARIEKEVGSDLFARTVSTGAAVFASVLSAGPAARFKAVGSVLHGFRGYAIGLWGMVHLASSGARIGPLLISLAVIMGTGLLALSLVAPGLPGAVAAAGLLSMLAGLTTALLLQLPVVRRRAIALGWVLLLLAATALVIALMRLGIAGLIKDCGDLLRRAPWDRIFRVSVVIFAMVVMAILGRVNHLPRADKKRPAPKQSCGFDHSPSS